MVSFKMASRISMLCSNESDKSDAFSLSSISEFAFEFAFEFFFFCVSQFYPVFAALFFPQFLKFLHRNELQGMIREHYPQVLVCRPEECQQFVGENSDHGGADVVLEVAGGRDTFQLAWSP